MDIRTCKKCQEAKPISVFHRQIVKSVVYHSYLCNQCRSSNRRKSYIYKPATSESEIRKAKESQKKSAKKYRKNLLDRKIKLMKTIGQTCCKQCEFCDINCLAFHHRNPKEKKFSIARGFSRRMRFEKLLEEARKCDILCNNCHVTLHATSKTKRAQRDFNRKVRLLNDTNQTSCKHCKCSDYKCLTFHHRNADEKEFEIPIGLHRYSYEKILKEAHKCDVLCLNCHMKLHAEERLGENNQ